MGKAKKGRGPMGEVTVRWGGGGCVIVTVEREERSGRDVASLCRRSVIIGHFH